MKRYLNVKNLIGTVKALEITDIFVNILFVENAYVF